MAMPVYVKKTFHRLLSASQYPKDIAGNKALDTQNLADLTTAFHLPAEKHQTKLLHESNCAWLNTAPEARRKRHRCPEYSLISYTILKTCNPPLMRPKNVTIVDSLKSIERHLQFCIPNQEIDDTKRISRCSEALRISSTVHRDIAEYKALEKQDLENLTVASRLPSEWQQNKLLNISKEASRNRGFQSWPDYCR